MVSFSPRAGWSSGMFRAVKLYQSVSTSGPSTTRYPSRVKTSTISYSVAVSGCTEPGRGRRPGSVTSTRSRSSWARRRGGFEGPGRCGGRPLGGRSEYDRAPGSGGGAAGGAPQRRVDPADDVRLDGAALRLGEPLRDVQAELRPGAVTRTARREQ